MKNLKVQDKADFNFDKYSAVCFLLQKTYESGFLIAPGKETENCSF